MTRSITGRTRAPSPVLPMELLVFGVVGVLVPYISRPLGLTLDTRPINEFVDHVVPGTLVVAVAVVALVRGRRSLTGSLVAVLAGFWMTATHVPLLRMAVDGTADMATSLFHSTPGAVILVVATVSAVLDTVAGEQPRVAAGGAPGEGGAGRDAPAAGGAASPRAAGPVED